NADYRYQAG
ncbi:fibronectin type III domain protein, partial [Escherichia coli FDA504]